MPFEWLNGKNPYKIYQILRNKGLIPIDERIEAKIGEMKERKRTEKMFELTFEERMSGKTLAEIQKDRENKLAAEWKRRKKEVLLHGYGEQK